MTRRCVIPTIFLAAGMACAGGLSAQTVDLRIVERTGRTLVSGPADAQLNFAVQARVTGADLTTSLNSFAFNIHLVGEPENYGTLARGLISELDGTYASAIATNATVGRGGLATSYAYLAALSAPFNGVINTSSGTFTNGPDQEIGLIAGFLRPLTTPGVDADGDGNPDTWLADPTAPHGLWSADIDPAIASTYWGAGGNWVDVYRFRYTPTNFDPRTLRVRLERVSAETCSRLENSGGWVGVPTLSAGAFALDLAIGVGEPATGSCCDPYTGGCAVYAVGECESAGGSFSAWQSCDPNPCPSPGSCCLNTGQCTVAPASACVGVWTALGVCDPSPCPAAGACCQASCYIRILSECQGPWLQDQTCHSFSCVSVGSCCLPSGTCFYTYPGSCSGGFSNTAACSPTYCPPIRSCCSQGGCTLTIQPGCSEGIWGAGDTCSPSPCPPMGACCGYDGSCRMTLPDVIACAGYSWSSAACAAQPCPSTGACCNDRTGACSVTIQWACTSGTFDRGGACSPGQCAPAGACCHAAYCEVTTPDWCWGGAWQPGACAPAACPQFGTCCAPSGACTIAAQSQCSASWTVGLVPCWPNPCPQPGRCCTYSGGCSVTLAGACAETWTPQETCGQPCGTVGGCCTAGHGCTMTLPGHCSGTYQGPGSVCGSHANPIACCLANFDHVDGINVRDLLEFSGLWFAGDLVADLDGDGTLSTLDFMTFMNIWWAGC